MPKSIQYYKKWIEIDDEKVPSYVVEKNEKNKL